MRIRNTNSRLRYPLDPATFINRWCEEGPTHHVALGIGHQVGRIEKLARPLGLEMAVVNPLSDRLMTEVTRWSAASPFPHPARPCATLVPHQWGIGPGQVKRFAPPPQPVAE